MPTTLIAGYIVRDDAEMLALTLPKTRQFVDDIVAVDAESTDGTANVLRSFGAVVENRPWNNNYADARNACIELAERHHKNQATLLMLDADEAINARDFSYIRAWLEDPATNELGVALARYEFVDDLFHFNPYFYPDYQVRMFPLHHGFAYRGKIHEQLYYQTEEGTAISTGKAVAVPYLHIFHYGKSKPIEKVWIKYENYRRLESGKPLLHEVPTGVKLPTTYSHGPKLVFHGERPI